MFLQCLKSICTFFFFYLIIVLEFLSVLCIENDLFNTIFEGNILEIYHFKYNHYQWGEYVEYRNYL